MKPYAVRLTEDAAADLERVVRFLAERDLGAAVSAVGALARAIEILREFPFACRKAIGGNGGPFLRELLVPFGQAGYVLLFQIESGTQVTILAIRDQREDDYH